MKSSTRNTVVMAAVALALMLLPTTSSAQGVLFVQGDKVGVGESTPDEKLHVKADAATTVVVKLEGAGAKNADMRFYDGGTLAGRLVGAMGNAIGNRYFGFIGDRDADGNKLPLRFFTQDAAGTPRDILFLAAGQPAGQSGNVGIGIANPSQPLQMKSGAYVTTGGVWTNASSRTFKQDVQELSTNDAFDALDELTPVKFRYKNSAEEEYLGFIAEDVPDLVSMNGRQGLNPMDVVAVLTKVVQQQQATISELNSRLAELESR
jgi:hypothetical protein